MLRGMMEFQMNGGMKSIFAGASARIGTVDAELRDKHTGKPAADIKPLAVAALRKIGVSLPDAELVAYAEAGSADREFTFHLS
jgi:hypothetical protein